MMPTLSETDRLSLARVVMSLFDSWRLEPSQQVQLLGLPASTKPRSLKRYTEDTPFPQDEDLLQRAGCFLSINSALLTTFPHHAAMARHWLNTPNRRFNQVTPLALMLTGLTGIYQVRGHLDCTENWL